MAKLTIESLMAPRIDWVEQKTAELLKRAKKRDCFGNSWFRAIVEGARTIVELEGYVWDVALAQQVEYYCPPKGK
jgi:hypothetical protein